MNSTHVRLGICCNHWRNGSFQGAATRFEFTFIDVRNEFGSCEVETQYIDRGLRMSFQHSLAKRSTSPDRIVLGRRLSIPFAGYQEWVGNWCWDACLICPGDAWVLFRILRRNGWVMDDGDTWLWDKWERIQVEKEGAT